MKVSKKLGLLFVLVMAASATAQGVAGKTRPIRVGMFKGTGTSAYWHTNMHTAGANIAGMLAANSTKLNMGSNVIVPDSGFVFTQYGLTSGQGTPTLAQTNAFIAALDTLDVAIISCMVKLGSVFTTPAQREALTNFWARKGYIALHASTDSKGSNWNAIDSMHGAQFERHPSSDRNATLHLDSVAFAENDWKFLNTGLTPGLTPATGDTVRFVEEWFSWETNGNVIRATPNLKVTVRIDEASYQGGLSPARSLGADHPMSWYRKTPGTGGRFFYSAVGHRSQNYDSLGPTPFLRRQIYNAILWAGGYDTAMTTSIRSAKAPGQFSDYSKVTFAPSQLTVTISDFGRHSVELVAIDGRRLGLRNGTAHGETHTFSELRPGVYSLVVNTTSGRSSRLVTVQ